jgi:serine/threonine-protein kinase
MVVCPSCRAEYEEASTRFCGRCGSEMPGAPRAAAVALNDPTHDPMIGRVVDGRYRILAKLGQGGMGSVYKVEHLAMGKLAAMKLLHPALTQDAEIGRRFRREAEAVSRLSHPNTVQVFDFGESLGLMYLVMELVKGEDLGQILRRDGPLPFRRARPILMQVCDALSEAHEAGVVHRDLKPENLLIARARDGHDVVKVLDFGLAKLRDSEELNTVTARGSLVGTPFYMSPEQIRGEDLDARSDLYSLGAVMYRLITGDHPFSAPTPVAVLTMHLTDELVLPSDRRPELAIEPAVDEIVRRAMAKRPQDRYGSADELKLALEMADAGAQVSGPRPLPQRRASDHDTTSPGAVPQLRREDLDAYEKQLRRRRWAGAIVLPLALLAAVAAAAVLWEARQPRALDTESEPNNSAAQANLIASERTVRGHIGTRISVEESDRDFFHFHVKRGTHVLRTELTGIPSMDLKLEIFDALGRRIAETDSGGLGEGEVIPNTRLDPGDYYLAVREVWVAGRPAMEDLTSWYTLTGSWHPLEANQESEPDDSPAQAVPLSVDQPMRGYLGRAGDVDYYYLRGEGGGTLSGYLSAVDGVDARIVVLPAGSNAGPPGPLPAGARVFDEGGVGSAESFDGLAWPMGAPGPIIVVERKLEAVPKRAAGSGSPGSSSESPRVPVLGRDIPYSLTVRIKR